MSLKDLVKQSYYYTKNGMLLHGDCLEWMKKIPDKSIDMVLADLPYGTTACKWDTVIPLDKLWKQYERIIKDDGAMIFTASQPFTSILVMSNLKLFKYEWIWEKNVSSNFMQYKFMPGKKHENVLVFCKNKTKYNPIMEEKAPSSIERMKYKYQDRKQSEHYKSDISKDTSKREEMKYPTSVKKFNREVGMHPTQKPVALFEYLIKTYTNENEIVLDNAAGVCTTAIACENLNRKWICIELEEEYCKKSVKRIEEHILQK